MLLFICLPGVSENSHFRHYNNKHGLSHNTVYCSLQDQRGFMWFGTEDGLNRFDGHTFKIYRHNSSHPNSLPNDHIGNLLKVRTEKSGYLLPEVPVITITRQTPFNRFGCLPDRTYRNRFPL